MIARIWRGWTKTTDTAAYADYVRTTGIAAYESTPGNLGAYLMVRTEGDRSEIVTLSFWDDIEAIEAFAGEDIERAVSYPEDDRYLVDRDLTVTHFEVV